jgi:hypothetical protein
MQSLPSAQRPLESQSLSSEQVHVPDEQSSKTADALSRVGIVLSFSSPPHAVAAQAAMKSATKRFLMFASLARSRPEAKEAQAR